MAKNKAPIFVFEYFEDKIFVVSQKTVKSAKVFPLEKYT